jgi:hypothetical protein
MTDNALNARAEINSSSGKFLVHDCLVGKIPSPAAVLFRNVGQQDAGPTNCKPSFVVGAVLFAPPRLVR